MSAASRNTFGSTSRYAIRKTFRRRCISPGPLSGAQQLQHHPHLRAVLVLLHVRACSHCHAFRPRLLQRREHLQVPRLARSAASRQLNSWNAVARAVLQLR